MQDEINTRYYRTKMRKRKGFIGCFVIGLVVLSLASGAVLGTLLEKTDTLPQVLQNLKGELSAITKLFRRDEGEILISDENILVCADTLGRTKPSSPDLFWLINYSSRQKKFFTIFIPPETVVDISGRGREELAKVFVYGKRPLMMSAINKLLGINIENYIIMEPQNFKLFDDFGRVKLSVSQNVAPDGPELGNQDLGGEMLRKYLSPQVDDTLDPQMRLDREKEVLQAFKTRLEELSTGEINDAVGKNYDSINSSLTRREMEGLFRTIANKEVKMASETLPARFDSSPEYCYFDPKPDEIKDLIAETILGKHAAKQVPPAQNSNPVIEVLNGAGKSGMAKEVARKLKEQGYDVPYVSKADRSDYSRTKISVFSQRAESDAARIKEIIGIGFIKVKPKQNSKVDIRILIGRDYLEI